VAPVVLPAQEETESEEETVQQLDPGPMWELVNSSGISRSDSLLTALFILFIKFAPLLLKLLPVIIIAALIKIYLIKRKFAIPWALNPMEKLSVTTLAETIVGMYFLLVFFIFFIPAVSSLIKDTALASTTTETGLFLKFLVHTLFALPYYCVVGGIISLLLFRQVSPEKTGKPGRYFKYGAILATIPAGLFIVFVFLSRIIFKWNYI
jgi:hypothetical protein